MKRSRTGKDATLQIDDDGRLWRDGKMMELRPKARLLLRTLNAAPGEIVAKDTLIRDVWGHDHVEPQALFQLISEIRAAAGDRNCITTYPNRGYQWSTMAPAGIPATRSKRIAFTALVALCLVGIGWQAHSPASAPVPLVTFVSPAVSAFDEGLVARESGDPGRAIAMFELAVAEHPHFAQAKLELARTLAQIGLHERAQSLAHDALSDARIVGDGYLEVTAQLILSEISWSIGERLRASTLTREAGQLARDGGYVCIAQLTDDLDRRMALALLDDEAASPFPQQSAPDLAACQRAHRRSRDETRKLEVFEAFLSPLHRNV